MFIASGWILYESGDLLVEYLKEQYFLEPRDSDEFYSFKVAVMWVLPCLSVFTGIFLLLLTRTSRIFSKFHVLKIILVLPGVTWLSYLNMMIFINPGMYWRQWFILVPLLIISFVVLMGTYYHVKVFRE